MTAFLQSAASRETSPEIIAAIWDIAGGNEDFADRVWEDPTYAEIWAVWDIVTDDGARDSTAFVWGASGAEWAEMLIYSARV
jgi:hypothetical protein